jgi:hypothetical protein
MAEATGYATVRELHEAHQSLPQLAAASRPTDNPPPSTRPPPTAAQEGLTIVWVLLIAVLAAAYFIQTRRLGALLPPSSSALLLGVAFGAASRAAGLAAPLRFSPDAFFYALLPPIVLSAGFALETKSFFDNVGAIAGETHRRCLTLCRCGHFHSRKLHSRSLPNTPPPPSLPPAQPLPSSAPSSPRSYLPLRRTF